MSFSLPSRTLSADDSVSATRGFPHPPSPEALFSRLLQAADVRIDGDRPWDIRVQDSRVFARVLAGGSLAFGDSYMDGWWECDALDECVTRILRADIPGHLRASPRLLLEAFSARVLNRQSARRAFRIAEAHYDLGNDLFEAMLGPTMQYSCGYWEQADTLDAAQTAKMDLLCRKLKLEKGMRLLDIGCGWGGLAEYAAREYGVTVTGVTVSGEQAEYARKRCAGLPVEIRLQDYRSLGETFDRIVSVGMFEHVGPRNYRAYMETVRRCLDPQGIFVLHSIGGNASADRIEPWLDKHIFPGAVLPSAAQVGRAMDGVFVLEDWHEFGWSYDKTLLAWEEQFRRSWEQLSSRYDERFYRMWRFYLLSCAGTFRARTARLWQIVLTPQGREGRYAAER